MYLEKNLNMAQNNAIVSNFGNIDPYQVYKKVREILGVVGGTIPGEADQEEQAYGNGYTYPSEMDYLLFLGRNEEYYKMMQEGHKHNYGKCIYDFVREVENWNEIWRAFYYESPYDQDELSAGTSYFYDSCTTEKNPELFFEFFLEIPSYFSLEILTLIIDEDNQIFLEPFIKNF